MYEDNYSKAQTITACYLLNPVKHLDNPDVIEVDQPRQLPVLDEGTALGWGQVLQEPFQVLVVLIDDRICREQACEEQSTGVSYGLAAPSVIEGAMRGLLGTLGIP